MHNAILRLGAALLLASVFHVAVAAPCGSTGPRPSWVDSPDSATDDYYYAAGLAGEPREPLADRMAAAKQNALKNLSEAVEVSVRNALTQEQASRRSGASEVAEATFTSITRTSTATSLRNVEVVATWEDPKDCVLWLRARVAKQHVEQARREGLAKMLFGLFDGDLGKVKDEALPVMQRLAAVDAAIDMLPRITFDLVPEASSAGYYRQLLDRAQKELGKTRDDLDQAKEALRDADRAVNRAATQTDEVARAKSLAAAVDAYRGLLGQHGDGLAPLFAPGDLLFKLGEVEDMRGNACGAKNYYQRAIDARQVDDRRAVAMKRADALPCSPDDMERALWRQRFEGRPTVIVCYYRAGADQATWHKACDGVNNIIRPLGADTRLVAKKLGAADLKAIESGGLPQGIAEPGKVVLGFFAAGKMNSRVDRESPGKEREYQFDGGLANFLAEDSKVVFSDRFQGKTGWNPVSPQMVMDVLALNVVKRWREKFSRFLRGEAE